MSAPSYRAYRDTGVEWLGAVPSHWQVVRLNSLFREVAEPGSDDLPVLSVSIHSGVSDTELADDEADRVVARSEDRSKYKRVEPNDLVYNMMRAWQGGFGAVQTMGAVSPAYVVARPTSSQSTRFIERLLRTPNAVGEMKRLSKGVTDFRLRLYWDEFKCIKVALPPPEEQAAIDIFLDRETAKIDALVETQRRLIELLKEKRQAVTSHAVTKGLDPSAPMKDSGVEWLGQVPAHWEVVPLKRYLSVLSGYAFPSAGFTDDPTEVPLLRGVNVGVGRIRWDDVVYWQRSEGDGLEGWRLAAGDLVIGMDRPWIAEGLRLAEVTDEDMPCLLLQRVAALRPSHGLTSDYLKLTLQGEAFYHHCVPEMTGVSVPHISPGQIHEFMVAIPPVDEQMRISTLLRSAAKDAGALVAAGEQAISLLQERRAVLISAAVTGKIDVRGVAADEAQAA